MFYVAGLLAALTGLFYASGNGDFGSFGRTVCSYSDTFCSHPSYLLVGVGIAAVWGAFVSI
ncbi:MAG: hypothetical protein K2W78_02135 [Xanthobacteraceae bacterium]|nr:hypothetical protein [Xanthobacteraceae bacterium]